MRCSVTSAIPVGLRSRVPAKMTSSMRTPRNVFADCSPSTQAMASEILDFPHPLGPTMAAMPSPGNLSSVRSQNDLKPRIWTFLSLSKFNSLRARARWRIHRKLAAGLLPKGSSEPIRRPSRVRPRASALRLWLNQDKQHSLEFRNPSSHLNTSTRFWPCLAAAPIPPYGIRCG